MSIPRGRKPGWLYACKPHSPALEARSSLSLNESILEQILSSRSIHKTFVYDHDHAMDPCLHPSILYQNGGFKMLRNGPATFNKLIPQFSSSITHLHYDLLPIPPPGWAEDEVRGRVPWEEKTQNRLLWRGTNTGMWASNETGYRDSQRFRLVELANRKDGEATVLRSPKRGEENAKVGEGERWDRKVLEEETVDIVFAGDPIQCEEPSCTDMKNEFRWAGRMDTNESNQYKYIIDVSLFIIILILPMYSLLPSWFSSLDRAGRWERLVLTLSTSNRHLRRRHLQSLRLPRVVRRPHPALGALRAHLAHLFRAA